jgi:hypothetical protein
MPEDVKLVIFSDKSVLEKSDGSSETFEEGKNSSEAKKRTKQVRDALAKGFLKELITTIQEHPVADSAIGEEQATKIKSLVDSVTSEVGRALIGITTMQLCIKAICPEQSIRLHKGGAGGANFSWKEGISMRTLDKSYITPVLREFDLLRLNADGFMMTRSLAENYPYSKLYKAALRGGKNEWLEIVEDLESGELQPMDGLKHLISLLINRSNTFIKLSDDCIEKCQEYLSTKPETDEVYDLIYNFVTCSEYSARAFEIVIHAAYQAMDEMDYIEGFLKPVSQMRSANKKHGNIGDIEILEASKGMLIKEAWDAKYGKPNLREELEELSEKLAFHPECLVAGFIADSTPIKTDEILRRIEELEGMYDCSVRVLSFAEWIDLEIKPALEDDYAEFCRRWLTALIESLCQRRREVAPIDEPCEHWIKSLTQILSEAAV